MKPTRRKFLKAAVASAALAAAPAPLAQAAGGAGFSTKINSAFLITPQEALAWAKFKSEGGPTYGGSPGWKRYTDFLLAKMKAFGAADIDYVEVPYDHYVVEDWPDRRSHVYDSGVAVEKLVSDGTPVPVVASYGMTSGATPPEGISAAMLYVDPASPPAKAEMAGKILVFATRPYPAPPYSDSFLDNYTPTDYEWRSPGKWPALFEPVPASVMSSYHSRWVFSQVNGFAATAIAGGAAGMVIVYDLSPGAAFGLVQRSVYTADGKAGLGAKYINCPTLTLDRVNGAKVLADAKAGKRATLTLKARFQRDTGRAIIAALPGKDYGTARDEQILLATHTDAMSLIEDDGGLGLLGIMAYFSHIPKNERPRTLIFYFDCRHFMPGGEGAWPEFDYYTIHPEKLKAIIATIGIEHMGGRQTIETGVGGNDYRYSSEKPEDGGVITSLMDVYGPNIWLVETIARAATDNHWPRVDVKAGNVEPGVHGGFQGLVKSPMNKGRAYKIPGLGLAGDWPGGWTQTYAQLDTEAGPHGFDENYFVRQVAGLTQITGELMLVKPIVIDLTWGELKSALAKLPDTALGHQGRQALMGHYTAAFRNVEAGRDGKSALIAFKENLAKSVAPESRAGVSGLVDVLLAKL